MRRLKSGILRLALVEGSDAGEEEGREECWRPRKRSESSEVLLRSLAEAVEGREGVAIERVHRAREGMYMRTLAPLGLPLQITVHGGISCVNVVVCICLPRK